MESLGSLPSDTLLLPVGWYRATGWWANTQYFFLLDQRQSGLLGASAQTLSDVQGNGGLGQGRTGSHCG